MLHRAITTLALLLAACTGSEAPPTHTITATITGLAGTGLAVSLNRGTLVPVAVNGEVVLAQGLSAGDAFEVSVASQPSSPTQLCTPQGGAGKVGAADVEVPITCVTSAFAVKALVTGLEGHGLTLLDNGLDPISVTTNGVSTFATRVSSGGSWKVTVATQPAGPTQQCVVTDGEGVVEGADVQAVVTCTTRSFPISARIEGLEGEGLVLSLDGVEVQASADGELALAAERPSGSPYALTVASQPVKPSQTCTVAAAESVVGGAAVVLDVSCVTNDYALRAEVSGLEGTGLVLGLLGGGPVPAATDGVVLIARVKSGASYTAVVGAQPAEPTQICMLDVPTGNVIDADVLVHVTCVTQAFAVKVLVTGLAGDGLAIANGGTDHLSPGEDGTYAFADPILSGAPYAITVTTQPTDPWQTCEVLGATPAAGTVKASDVLVTLACHPNTYAVRATVSGLRGGQVTLALNGGAGQVVVADGPFTFPTTVDSGRPFAVTVVAQPATRSCLVRGGEGVMAGSAVDVDVACYGLVNTVLPAVTGPARVFGTLATTTGTWTGASNPTFAIQWRRCNATGLDCADVAGATGATLVLGRLDFGYTLRARVTATAAGESLFVDSTPTAIVAEPACAQPQTLGPAAPSVVENLAASVAWAHADRVTLDDDQLATAGPLLPGQYTDTLEVKGFGFTIPTSAKIRQVAVELERSSANGLVVDHVVQLETAQSGSQNLAKTTAWAKGGGVVTYGGPGVGANFTAADVNAPSFLVRVAARQGAALGEDEARLDRVSVKVTYTEATLAGPYTASQVASVDDPAVANEARWTPLTPSTLATTDGVAVETGDFVANGRSDWLQLTGFGVALPANAVPSGVLVEAVRKVTQFDWAIHTELARLVRAGTPDATTYTQDSPYDWALTPNWQTGTWGSAGDLWNASNLTAADVIDPGFGVALRLRASIGSAVAGMHAKIDSVRLWVAYDPVEKSAIALPTVTAQQRVGVAWGTPEEGRVADGKEAWAQLVSGNVSDVLRVRGFGLAVPAGAWVRGVTVDVKRRCLSRMMWDRTLRLTGEPAATASRAAPETPWANTATVERFGSATDRWGAPTLDPVALANSRFGVELATDYRTSGGNDVAYVDAISAKVTYCTE